MEGQSAGSTQWRAVAPEQVFCPGDKVRTLERSRARLELSNQTYLALDQKTTVIFSDRKPQPLSWLELLKGAIYLRSRTPSALDIRAPFVNALIKGTEFLVASDDEQSQVTVFEGVVEAYNPQGSLILTDGQTAVAKAGQTPMRKILLRPEDAVQWALYYPPILDLARLEKSELPAVRQAVSHYLTGDLTGALATLVGQVDNSAQVLRAGLLLSLGRVDEGEPLLTRLAEREPVKGEAVALQAIIALARNDLKTARRLADQAVSLEPGSPVPWTARSYVQQAQFRLEDALKSAREAAGRDPGNALAQTRLAELYASLGRRSDSRKAAEKAIALSPRSPRAHAVLGYVQLMAMDAKEAERSFRDAIRLDSADPLARFGLGLAKIRRGLLKEGTSDLELAASLDPNDALFRSYLGKAYYDLRRGKVAETEFTLAKTFDPKDPTPWFYDAIKKQTENRPVEALHDLQKAIELNDNRAVYRSRQLLDDDLAARSAAQGRIYNDLGFGQRALVEGWKSVNTEPSNYSGHRFLADNYAALPRHEIARVSELLQSQLLQPINITPVQPSLAESKLLILEGSGPSTASFNEFNPLFTRNRLALQASGVFGSNDTLGDELTQSGVWNKFSYSLGQFHLESDGFRENNDLKQDIYDAFIQMSLTPTFNVQTEYRHLDVEHGDLQLNWHLDKADPFFRRALRTDIVRVGTRYAPYHHSKFIASGIYQDTTEEQEFELFDASFTSESYLGEAQYLFNLQSIGVVMGGGYLNSNNEITGAESSDTQHRNSYLYSFIRYPSQLTWTIGASFDSLEDDQLGDFDQVNPKLGLIWRVTPNTTLRLAAFRILTRSLLNDQTIEPTQVAGFNQLFDDSRGTESRRYGIALDQTFSRDLYGGIEVSKRDLKVPMLVAEVVTEDWEEELYRAYLNWAPHPRLAISAEYQLEYFDRDIGNIFLDLAPKTRTHVAPLTFKYFGPSGFFTQFKTTYVNQKVEFTNGLADSDEFVLLDVGIGYRLPKRHGIVSIQVRNLLDQSFNFQGLGDRTFREDPPPFLPERTISGQITLAF
ncbi:MAG: TonB-dependent receptor [Pseudomonadota bacterium]